MRAHYICCSAFHGIGSSLKSLPWHQLIAPVVSVHQLSYHALVAATWYIHRFSRIDRKCGDDLL